MVKKREVNRRLRQRMLRKEQKMVSRKNQVA
jgi:hypothetical protein